MHTCWSLTREIMRDTDAPEALAPTRKAPEALVPKALAKGKAVSPVCLNEGWWRIRQDCAAEAAKCIHRSRPQVGRPPTCGRGERTSTTQDHEDQKNLVATPRQKRLQGIQCAGLYRNQKRRRNTDHVERRVWGM